MIGDLRPMILDEAGVIDAIEHLIAEQQENTGLRIRFSHDVRFDRLDPMLEGAIFRIVQEALNNVKRHAKTESASVRLSDHNGELDVVIHDQGIGFDIASVASDRFGLRGIRERARLFGGDATIETTPGEGTRICVKLPIVPAS